MIYLDIKISEFFKQHSTIYSLAKESCEEHGYDLHRVQPYITKEMVGVILNPDATSRRRKIFTHRDVNKQEFYGNLIANTLLQ